MSAARKPKSRRTGASKSTSKKAAKKTSARATRGKTKKKTPARKKATKATPKKTANKTTQKARTKTSAARTRRQATPRKSSKRRPASRKLDSKSLVKIRQQLVEERAALRAEMTELEEESFQATQSEITGEVGIDEDFADAGSATYDREQALSIANNIRDLIDQVDRAIGRIDEGTYGACERCGRPIDPARLRALPRTLLCTDCKRREERAR
jgi:DnaK suppressor protein